MAPGRAPACKEDTFPGLRRGLDEGNLVNFALRKGPSDALLQMVLTVQTPAGAVIDLRAPSRPLFAGPPAPHPLPRSPFLPTK